MIAAVMSVTVIWLASDLIATDLAVLEIPTADSNAKRTFVFGKSMMHLCDPELYYF